MYTTKNNKSGAEIFPQIDRVLNEIFNTTINHAVDEKKNKYSQPSANVKEFKDRFEIYLAVPGMEKDDIKVKVEKNILTMSAEKEVEQDSTYKLTEFKYGTFSRTFKLPETVDVSTIDATLKNGVLTIHIGKRKEDIDNGPKEITIG